MSLYNRLVPVVENTTIEEVNIVSESLWLGNATVELTQDIFRVMEASDVADIVGEYSVIKEGAEVEAVLENIIKGGIEKFKAAFKKFWDKIKAFFAEVKRQIMLLFTRGEKFVKEFEKEILNKKATGYKYMSYKYDDKGLDACNKVVLTATVAISGALSAIDKLGQNGSIKDVNDKATIDDGIKALIAAGAKLDGDVNKMEEEFIKDLGVSGSPSTVSELSTELNKMCRGGAEKGEKEELEDFEGTSRKDLIDLIKGQNKALAAVKKVETTFDSSLSGIIKKLDELATKKDASETYYKAASHLSTICNKLLAIGKVGTQVMTETIKEQAAEAESILKGFLRFKPAKEATTEPEVATEGSLFDSIYATIC